MRHRTFDELLAEAEGDEGFLLAAARENLRLYDLFDEGVGWAIGAVKMTYEECQLVINLLAPRKRPDPTTILGSMWERRRGKRNGNV